LCVSGRLPFDSGGKFLVGGEHLHLHAVQQIGANLWDRLLFEMKG
jgi:hypothetical protein